MAIGIAAKCEGESNFSASIKPGARTHQYLVATVTKLHTGRDTADDSCMQIVELWFTRLLVESRVKKCCMDVETVK